MSINIQKAATLIECINSFEPEPLRGDDYDNMFCDTHEARTGNITDNRILDLIDSYLTIRSPKHTLLIGHTGCGKSTEMQTFIREMVLKKHLVADISAKEKLDLRAVTYIDLLIMIMIELVQNAASEGIEIDSDVVNNISQYWNSIITNEKIKDSSLAGKLELGVDSELSVFAKFLKFLGSLKMVLKTETLTRNAVKTIIEPEISEFIENLRYVSQSITEELKKQSRPPIPIIVVDDLDKLEVDRANELFYNHGGTLTLLPIHVIYTFPIQMSYTPQFASLDAYFESVFLPMIKLQNWVKGTEYEQFLQGPEVIKCIVHKRANAELFEENALDHMIKMTGGYLRDLFKAIMNAARIANRRGSYRIELEDTKVALNKIQSDITRSLKSEHYKILQSIFNGDKRKIDNREELLDLLQSRVILEYNGRRWCDLHPLVEELLISDGVLEKKDDKDIRDPKKH